MFNVVNNGYDDTASDIYGNDNVMKGEWISMFPALKAVEIKTLGDVYKFRFEALLESIQSIPSSVMIVVDDEGHWIESALTDEISTAYDAAGWNIEYKKRKLVIKWKGH